MKKNMFNKYIKILGLSLFLLISACGIESEDEFKNEEWGFYLNGVVAKVYLENFTNPDYQSYNDRCVVAGYSFKANMKFSVEPYQGDTSGCRGSKYKINFYEIRFRNVENDEVKKVESLNKNIEVTCDSNSQVITSFNYDIPSSALKIDSKKDTIHKFKVQLYAGVQNVPNNEYDLSSGDASHTYGGKILVVGSTKKACDDYIANNPQ